MATKAKTPAPAATPSIGLEARLTAALEQLHGKHPAEGEEALRQLLQEAKAEGRFPVARRISHVLAARHPSSEKPKAVKEDAAFQAILQLNRRKPDQALEVLDKALKSDGKNGHLLFLKATAFAQLGRPEEVASTLKSALEAEPGLMHQVRLEPDFDAVRRHPAVSALL